LKKGILIDQLNAHAEGTDPDATLGQNAGLAGDRIHVALGDSAGRCLWNKCSPRWFEAGAPGAGEAHPPETANAAFTARIPGSSALQNAGQGGSPALVSCAVACNIGELDGSSRGSAAPQELLECDSVALQGRGRETLRGARMEANGEDRLAGGPGCLQSRAPKAH
jgi:hypothetical protein